MLFCVSSENAKEDEQAKEETALKDKNTETEVKAPAPVGIVTRSRDSSKGKRQQTEEVDNIKATNEVVSENKVFVTFKTSRLILLNDTITQRGVDHCIIVTMTHKNPMLELQRGSPER